MTLIGLLSHYTETLLFGILGFVLMMSFVVFIHEYGHFAVARLCGVKVLDFSIGFGNKIFSKQDKYGTNWSLSLIPMGGYVRFFGDKSAASDEDIDALQDMSDSDKKQSFYFKPIPQKIAIILAGPLANILLCFMLLFLSSFFIGVVQLKPIIQTVVPNTAAARNGLIAGDVFSEIDGKKIKSASDVRQQVIVSFGKKMDFKIIRGSKTISLSLTPDMVEVAPKEKMPTLGVVFQSNKEDNILKRYDFINSAQDAYQKTYFFGQLTLTFFKELFSGNAPLTQMNGPVRIGDAAGGALKEGAWSFLFLMAIISMSIGIVNLLPVPMLDGGHLMFYIFESLGLKASDKLREILFKAGFVLVMFLMAFTVVNDIMIIGER